MIEDERGLAFSKKHYFLATGLIFLIALVVLAIFLFFPKAENVSPDLNELKLCGDSSFYDTCSLIKPYYCFEGNLVEKASLCGCDFGEKSGEKCILDYSTGEKEIHLKYVLRGESGEIGFSVYSGVIDYLINQSKIVTYSGEEIISRRDSNLISINEKIQELYLMQLVKEIQGLTNDKDDQARIAISLVQSIPFGETDKTVKFVGGQAPYTRFPYEVLYENEGICEEKSNLLAFLLKELGYGVSLFYQNVENHASLGIRCPYSKSYKETGYCFVETTGPSIIGDENIEYEGGLILLTDPEVSLISEGLTFGEKNFYEYEDAKKIAKVYLNGNLGRANSNDFNSLSEKYGLAEFYNL